MMGVITETSYATTMPLFAAISACDQCFDIGHRVAPQGHVESCPRIQCGLRHPPISDQGEMISRAIELLRFRELDVDARHFEVARTLAGFTAERPCTNDELVERCFAWVVGNSERQRREVSKAIRFLRDIWFLPVGSRKDKPSGYWICITEAEFREYFERASREPITYLSTLHRMAKANWPGFAGQINMDFFSDEPTGTQEVSE